MPEPERPGAPSQAVSDLASSWLLLWVLGLIGDDATILRSSYFLHQAAISSRGPRFRSSTAEAACPASFVFRPTSPAPPVARCWRDEPRPYRVAFRPLPRSHWLLPKGPSSPMPMGIG